MPRITVSVSDDQAERIEELADGDGPYSSKSEVMRYFIQRSQEADELERENERLHRERRQLLDRREERNELVRYAEDQREQEQRAQNRREKPVWTRVRWWVLGEPST
jgi:Arc/MetJ-type ribon-helix-helix transcriptional regulator